MAAASTETNYSDFVHRPDFEVSILGYKVKFPGSRLQYQMLTDTITKESLMAKLQEVIANYRRLYAATESKFTQNLVDILKQLADTETGNLFDALTKADGQYVMAKPWPWHSTPAEKMAERLFLQIIQGLLPKGLDTTWAAKEAIEHFLVELIIIEPGTELMPFTRRISGGSAASDPTAVPRA